MAGDDAGCDRAHHHGAEGQEDLLPGDLTTGMGGRPTRAAPASRERTVAHVVGQLVPGDALVDAAVNLGADPLDQARCYRIVVRGAEVTVRPDRCRDLLIHALAHASNTMEPQAACPSSQPARSR
jgi:hypothetical protein